MKKIGRPIRIAIADSSNLIYSDDYRNGWAWGFAQLGVEVRTFDVSRLSSIRGHSGSSIYSSKGWNQIPRLLAQEVSAWGPNLLFAHHGRAASHRTFMEHMRNRKIPTAIYLCDEPYEVGETARWSPSFTYVFTLDPCTIDIHQAARGQDHNVFYLPPGVNTDHFRYIPYDKRRIKHRALFLGNASLTPRPDFLKQVEKEVAESKIMYWETVGKHKKKNLWIPLKDHPALYSSCMIGLNVHRDPAITEQCFKQRVKLKRSRPTQGIVKCKSPPPRWGTGFWNDSNTPAAHVNPRFFEMSAVGTCVVSDGTRPELARMFPDAPRARNPDEFLDLVDYFLLRPKEMARIGQECSSLISKRHTYVHRAAEILIRCGLMDASEAAKSLSLGEPEEWLTRQDFSSEGVVPSLVCTGVYEPYDPLSGSAVTRMSGRPSGDGSLGLQVPWG